MSDAKKSEMKLIVVTEVKSYLILQCSNLNQTLSQLKEYLHSLVAKITTYEVYHIT